MTMMAGLMRYVFGLNRLFSAQFRSKKASLVLFKTAQKTPKIYSA